MLLPLHNHRLTTFTISSMAIILGILWWLVASEFNRSSRTLLVPLCFYNSALCKIEAPESITVTLGGKRSHLRALNPTNIAIHIDAETITEKTTVLSIRQEHLLLPQNINLVSYSPSNPLVKRERIP